MAPARIVRARIVILTAGLVGTLTARVPAVEPDQVLELRVLTYAAFEAAEVQIALQTAQPLLASGGIQTEWRQCVGNDGCAESSSRPSFRPRATASHDEVVGSVDFGRCDPRFDGTDGRAGLRSQKCGDRSDATPKSRGALESSAVDARDGTCRRPHDRA